jgi:hypothetical protein
MIVYYPELKELISNLGFADSTSLIRYLRDSGAPYTYMGRTYTSEDRIPVIIKELNVLMKGNCQDDKCFIFVMSVPNSTNIDVLDCYGLSKDEFIKYLTLKVFS